MTLLMARNSPHLPMSFENFQHRVLLRIYNLIISCRLSNLLQSSKFQVYLFPPSRTFLPNHQYYLNYLMDPIHPHFHSLHLSLIHFIGSHPACKQYYFPEKFDSRLQDFLLEMFRNENIGSVNLSNLGLQSSQTFYFHY